MVSWERGVMETRNSAKGQKPKMRKINKNLHYAFIGGGEMTQPPLYEIVETRYGPKKTATLDFKGTFEEAKKRLWKKRGRI